jgi:methyl-accepting chemotaxis protein
VAGSLLAWSLSVYAATASDVSRTHEYLGRVQHFLTTLEDMETGQRGFLITGAERYLDPYHAALARVASETRMLRLATASDPDLLAQVDRISVLAGEKINELEETIRLRREQGEDAARAIVVSDRGLRSMDEMRRVIAQVEFDASARLAARTGKQQQSLQWIKLASFGGLVLGLTFIFLAARQTRRAERIALSADEQRKQQEGEFRLLADSIPLLAWMA